MEKVTVVYDPDYAPCSFILCRVDKNGEYDAYSSNPKDSILFQINWDFPKLAEIFGYCCCPCGETDGTVDCAHKTTDQMIAEAREYIMNHLEEIANDPGYFVEE